MRAGTVAALIISAGVSVMNGDDDIGLDGSLSPQLQTYVRQRSREFEQIPAGRKDDLQKIAKYVKSQIQVDQPARLIFVCTHNSRRSQMSQIWAAAAASYYGIGKVEVFSGGTEVTAFNPLAVAALERAWINIEKSNEGENPGYLVRFREGSEPLICFSKIYSDTPNPTEEFCAVMTCTQADKNCPVVQGCSLRAAISYEDPKAADNTAQETATYDERCAQISREMLYLFSLVKN